jgi:hypothetical protein
VPTKHRVSVQFQRMTGGLKKAAVASVARDALLTATHVADSHLIQAQDAHVTAGLLQNLGPVLQALHPSKDAVCRRATHLESRLGSVRAPVDRCPTGSPRPPA